jgi:hypothetical protein
MSALSLLSGVKRKSGLRAVRSVVDPEQTLNVGGSPCQSLRRRALRLVTHKDAHQIKNAYDDRYNS